MNFHSDDLLNIYENGELPAFYCDSQWNISSLNSIMGEKFPDIKVMQNICDFSQNNAAFFLEAREKLAKGLPFFSTNFKILFHNATIYIFPYRENENKKTQQGNNLPAAYSLYLCTLDIQTSSTKDPLLSITDSMRSPINDILNSASFLGNRAEIKEDYQTLDYLTHIAKCCYSMLRTTTSAKTYYALVNHTQPIEIRKMALNDFLTELFQTIRVLFLKSKFNFKYSVCTEKIISKIDPELLSLAIFHLISNACVASPQQAEIVVSLTCDESQENYFITVSDEGSGIKNEILSDIFKPFFVSHDMPFLDDDVHLGLGLPIVEEILKVHNGIVFFNTRETKGTRVTMKLPITSPTDEPLTLQANIVKYATNKFSSSYILFSDICDINLL